MKLVIDANVAISALTGRLLEDTTAGDRYLGLNI
jgi:predicted nucleic acid-binding protein